jgi:phage tail sheath protein FI
VTVELPGYRVVDGPRTVAEDGLRNDVAAFLGSTARGPCGTAVRVTSRQEYDAVFGGLSGTVPRAVAAYFLNGGQVAWVVRTGRSGAPATARLPFGELNPDGTWTGDGPVRISLPGTALDVQASSAGTWADGTSVRVDYRAYGRLGRPVLDLVVHVRGDEPRWRTGLAPDELVDAITSTGLLTAAFVGPPGRGTDSGAGPARRSATAVLTQGEEPTLDLLALQEAVAVQAQVEEIAMVCVPDLSTILGPDDQDAALLELAAAAAGTQDRIVVCSAPVTATDVTGLADWTTRAGQVLADPALGRAVAAYFPRLLSEHLAPSGPDRYASTDPVGHVCGRIAELDRERGSGWSPSNTLVRDAVDVATPLPPDLQATAYGLGVNLLRPRVGGGLEIWGARTMDRYDGRFLAHRRLVHRIVRAARRVTEPLVFDVNDELLRFSVARAINGVLMEAFRTGALKGAAPEEAYRVRCDETTNPPESVDAGEVVCEIDVAPAVPMEFITLRLTLGPQGLLEVVER